MNKTINILKETTGNSDYHLQTFPDRFSFYLSDHIRELNRAGIEIVSFQINDHYLRVTLHPIGIYNTTWSRDYLILNSYS